MGTVRYTVIDGEVIAENRNGVRSFYVPDPLGSTVALIDNTATVTDTFSYWPYGEVQSHAGSPGNNPTPLQYVGTAGYYTDSASKTYVRARVLDTPKARWLTQDPIGFGGGDYNLYRYVLSCPLTAADPSGQKVWECIAPLRSVGHHFISTDACGAWGFRKKGIGFCGPGTVEPDDNYLKPDPKNPTSFPRLRSEKRAPSGPLNKRV